MIPAAGRQPPLALRAIGRAGCVSTRQLRSNSSRTSPGTVVPERKADQGHRVTGSKGTRDIPPTIKAQFGIVASDRARFALEVRQLDHAAISGRFSPMSAAAQGAAKPSAASGAIELGRMPALPHCGAGGAVSRGKAAVFADRCKTRERSVLPAQRCRVHHKERWLLWRPQARRSKSLQSGGIAPRDASLVTAFWRRASAHRLAGIVEAAFAGEPGESGSWTKPRRPAMEGPQTRPLGGGADPGHVRADPQNSPPSTQSVKEVLELVAADLLVSDAAGYPSRHPLSGINAICWRAGSIQTVNSRLSQIKGRCAIPRHRHQVPGQLSEVVPSHRTGDQIAQSVSRRIDRAYVH